MELDPQTMRRVWWKGAIGGALKGIPQGLILGAVGTLLLVGLCAVLPASWGLASAMGGFLFSNPAAGLALSNISFVPMLALNTVLTAVGNFIHGGKIACNAYKQEAEHRMNEARISQIEAREMAMEQHIAPSRNVEAILARGPRAGQGFEAAEATRESSASGPALH